GFLNGYVAGWLTCGLELSAGGYEVAWKVTGSNTFSIWTTDSNGNFISSTPALTGADYALQSAEARFFQDLNGDGHIGPTTTVLRSEERRGGKESRYQLLP